MEPYVEVLVQERTVPRLLPDGAVEDTYELLSDGEEWTTSELADHLETGQYNAQRAAQMLHAYGLVRREKDAEFAGQRFQYQYDPERVVRFPEDEDPLEYVRMTVPDLSKILQESGPLVPKRAKVYSLVDPEKPEHGLDVDRGTKNTEIADAMGVSLGSVKNILDQLQDIGLVGRVAMQRGHHYYQTGGTSEEMVADIARHWEE